MEYEDIHYRGGYLKVKKLEEGTISYFMDVPCTLEFTLKVKMGMGYPDQKSIYAIDGFIPEPDFNRYRLFGSTVFHPGLVFSKSWVKPLPKKIAKSIIKNILSSCKCLPQTSYTKRKENDVYREFNIDDFRDFLFDELKSIIAKDLVGNTYNRFLFDKIIKGDVSIE